jgi:hypothetical protein
VDEKGRFSFIAFEGYSYVVHVHAVNKDDKPMHAKHQKITVGEKNPVLKFVLSLPGYGEDEAAMKRERAEPN